MILIPALMLLISLAPVLLALLDLASWLFLGYTQDWIFVTRSPISVIIVVVWAFTGMVLTCFTADVVQAIKEWKENDGN